MVKYTFCDQRMALSPAQLFGSLWRIPRSVAVGLMSVYQFTLSPDHGALKGLYPHGYCRHHPTCSMYGKRVIAERGLIIGGLLTIGRVLTCNPWSKPSKEKMRGLLKQ
jgi:putative component of membrane protein insertase Oxa1/YidC/SpoIIIJ protein YidD